MLFFFSNNLVVAIQLWVLHIYIFLYQLCIEQKRGRCACHKNVMKTVFFLLLRVWVISCMHSPFYERLSDYYVHIGINVGWIVFWYFKQARSSFHPRNPTLSLATTSLGWMCFTFAHIFGRVCLVGCVCLEHTSILYCFGVYIIPLTSLTHLMDGSYLQLRNTSSRIILFGFACQAAVRARVLSVYLFYFSDCIIKGNR